MEVEDVISQIPDEAWPLIAHLFNATMVFTAAWLVWSVFVAWRRSASNLTSIRGVTPNPKAEPDFLSVDHKARKAALARGEQFERDLERRDKDEARSLKSAARRRETMITRIGRLLSFGMALFSIGTMISGTLFQVSIMGSYWEKYSGGERLMAVVEDHPIGVSVTVAVILYNVVSFIISRRKEG